MDTPHVIDRIAIPLEIFHAMKKDVAEWGWVCHTSCMPDQGATDKAHFTMRIPIILRKRLQRIAKDRGETLTEVVLGILQKAVHNIELTPEDFRQIADEVEKNKAAIKGRKANLN